MKELGGAFTCRGQVVLNGLNMLARRKLTVVVSDCSSQGRCGGDPVQLEGILLCEDVAMDDVVL